MAANEEDEMFQQRIDGEDDEVESGDGGGEEENDYGEEVVDSNSTRTWVTEDGEDEDEDDEGDYEDEEDEDDEGDDEDGEDEDDEGDDDDDDEEDEEKVILYAAIFIIVYLTLQRSRKIRNSRCSSSVHALEEDLSGIESDDIDEVDLSEIESDDIGEEDFSEIESDDFGEEDVGLKVEAPPKRKQPGKDVSDDGAGGEARPSKR